VLDTGESSIFLDSRWSLPRTRYGAGMTPLDAINVVVSQIPLNGYIYFFETSPQPRARPPQPDVD